MMTAWTYRLAGAAGVLCALGACAQEQGGTTSMEWGRELSIVGNVDTHGTCRALALRGDAAFVCADYHGLVTVDISDPAAPKIVGGCDTWMAFDIALKGDYAFVADRYGGLQVINISDPHQPLVITTYDSLEFVTGIALAGRRLPWQPLSLECRYKVAERVLWVTCSRS